MTSPTLPPLVVPVEKVARLAGLDHTDENVQYVVEEAIRAATVDVEAYLGRFVVPTEVVETRVVRAWNGLRLRHSPVRDLVATVAEVDADDTETGLYTVTYVAGIDAAAEAEYAPIRNWVTAAAQVFPPVRRLVAAAGKREVRTVSAEGQSVTYENSPKSSDVPTAGVPPLSSVDRWRNADMLVSQDHDRPERNYW